jgi:hypothetical protein
MTTELHIEKIGNNSYEVTSNYKSDKPLLNLIKSLIKREIESGAHSENGAETS